MPALTWSNHTSVIPSEAMQVRVQGFELVSTVCGRIRSHRSEIKFVPPLSFVSRIVLVDLPVRYDMI